jgi:hypothetical protein
MKYIISWTWKAKDGPAVTERFSQWKPVEGTKFLFPIHTVIGANKAFTISETDDVEVLVKNVQPWTDLCTFKVSPIIDTRELMALSA